MKFIGVVLVILAICALSLCFALGYYYFFYFPHFQVRHVKITGCNKVSPLDILERANINGPTNLLLLSLEEISERLSENPWLDEVELKRVFPDTLEIEVSERKPVAVVSTDALYYADRKGILFKRVTGDDPINYPTIIGIEEYTCSEDDRILLRKALDLIEWTTEPHTTSSNFPKIANIHVDKDTGLTFFTLNRGIQIEMGLNGFKEKCERLRRLVAFMKNNGDWMNVAWINLNCGKRIFVKRTSSS